MDILIIKIIAGKWFVNEKPLSELTPNEKHLLDHFFLNLKNSLEKSNRRLKNLKAHNYKFKNKQDEKY